LNPIVHHSVDYKEKELKLKSYDKLNVTASLRLFENSIEYMKSNNFQVKTLDVIAKVNYALFDVVFHYSAKDNFIVIMDLI